MKDSSSVCNAERDVALSLPPHTFVFPNQPLSVRTRYPRGRRQARFRTPTQERMTSVLLGQSDPTPICRRFEDTHNYFEYMQSFASAAGMFPILIECSDEFMRITEFLLIRMTVRIEGTKRFHRQRFPRKPTTGNEMCRWKVPCGLVLPYQFALGPMNLYARGGRDNLGEAVLQQGPRQVSAEFQNSGDSFTKDRPHAAGRLDYILRRNRASGGKRRGAYRSAVARNGERGIEQVGTNIH